MATTTRAHLAAAAVALAMSAMLITGWSIFEFDHILTTYAFATVVGLYGLTHRLVVWGQRPCTSIIFRRAAKDITAPKNLLHLVKRGFGYFVLNRFVMKRGMNRWGAHWPIMIGCVMASAIAFPLVFGWIWFETPADNFGHYQIHAFGIHLRTIDWQGFEAFMMFHGLVWAAFFVIAGVTVALIRRLRDRGDQAVQTFGNDIMPLVLLLLISFTGLGLTVSYTWLDGFFHHQMAVIHAATICFTALWLPYSKLFHIAQRSLKAAHMVYDHAAQDEGMAKCANCGAEFATMRQVNDLINVEQDLGYNYQLPNSAAGHWQHVCPRCRRSLLVRAQSARWAQHRSDDLPAASPNLVSAGPTALPTTPSASSTGK